MLQGQTIDEAVAKRIDKAGIEELDESVLYSLAKVSVWRLCERCYGANTSTGAHVEYGISLLVLSRPSRLVSQVHS